MTLAQVVARLRLLAAREGQAALAKRFRCAPQYISLVLSRGPGRKPPGPKILRGLGLVREVRYVPRKEK